MTTKIDPAVVRESLQSRLQDQGRVDVLDQCRQLQAVVYVMYGGGFLGCAAAQQPADFYIGTRVGKRPYSSTKIKQAVEVLTLYAEVLGLNPHDLNPSAELGRKSFMDCHNCGVF